VNIEYLFREHTKQRQSSPTSTAATANIVETAVDLEDRLAKEYKNFQFMPRETGALSFLL
jgi:hypothetical protein